MKWISIEGNIGIGKSTLLAKLADYIGWNHLDERVEEDPEFQDLLAQYYEDSSVSIKLQTWLTKRRFNDIKNLSEGNWLVERSIFGDIVFTTVNNNMGTISREDYSKYQDFAVSCLDKIELPKQIIYLRADPEVCFKRTLHRNRECENGISQEYINKIHEGYEGTMMDFAKSYEIPVITIPYNEFLSTDEVIKLCWKQMI